ncbi:DUF6268 family outer membrane beta-barrel protein [Draconibacterium sp. IB214405]|uniref:DUF6268 family outer membrane beta-barrel protein n=1 Tax=Draconibacterium sp. IB214405 TaxID=3097352 RepID=UPI002A103DA5|nr:DUF6268 family outer membrane beta-barrel protein [Draconibacterium sp. IB214405]MDX8341149.1 DUF6268 family outer membrane beta-barrel protein [Draconibacterium sp. IB214405]
MATNTNDFYLAFKESSKGYLLILALILFTHVLCAQTTAEDSKKGLNTKNSIDTASQVSLTKFPLATTDFLYYPKSNFKTKSGNGTIGMNEYNFTLQYAIPLKERKLYFYNKIDLSVFSYNVFLESTDLEFQETYRSLDFTVGLIKVLPKNWRLALNFSPTLASDFKDKLSSDDFIYQFSALAVKRAKDNLQYGMGIAYTSRFGKLTLLPLINLTYRKNNWLTSVLLPTYMSQFYCFNESSRIGLSANVNGDYYNVRFDAIPTTIDLNKASYSRITIGPEYQFKLFGDLYLDTGIGISVRNILAIQNEDLKEELSLDVDSKYFFRMGLKILK